MKEHCGGTCPSVVSFPDCLTTQLDVIHSCIHTLSQTIHKCIDEEWCFTLWGHVSKRSLIPRLSTIQERDHQYTLFVPAYMYKYITSHKALKVLLIITSLQKWWIFSSTLHHGFCFFLSCDGWSIRVGDVIALFYMEHWNSTMYRTCHKLHPFCACMVGNSQDMTNLKDASWTYGNL